MSVPGAQRPEQSLEFSGTGIMGSCELPCECLELNSSPLKENPELLTAGPSHQLIFLFSSKRSL